MINFKKVVHVLYGNKLIKYILILKYQFFNRKSLSWVLLLITTMSSSIWSVYNITSWVVQHSCYSLSDIIVTGKRYYTTNTDIYQAIKELGVLGTFITQDVSVVQKKIELLPWVRQVSVRTQWPDVLKIHVVEHEPIALWNDRQMISVTGEIFNIAEEYQDNYNKCIPILYGPEGSEQEILIYYYIFNEILKKSSTVQIKSLKMDARYSWQLFLKNNIHVKLGRKHIVEQLNYFIKIYPIVLHKINENDKYIDYIDLRYVTGFVVKWIPHATTSVLRKQ